MTKRDIVRRAAFEANIEIALAGRVVQLVLDSVTDSLVNDSGIDL